MRALEWNQENCQRAEELYESQGLEGDTEMEMLRTMLKDLEEGGWFQDNE